MNFITFLNEIPSLVLSKAHIFIYPYSSLLYNKIFI